MSNTETWGIVLRNRDGAEQWIACEVTRDDRGRFRAKSVAGDDGMSYAFDVAAVGAHARWIERTDATVAHARCVTREAYAAHMEGVCPTLAIDLRAEVAQLRASIANREVIIGELRAEATRLADTLGAIGRSVGAESCDRDVILAAIRDRGEDAFRRGAEAMREAAAKRSDDSASWYGEHDNLVGGGAQVASMALRRNAIQTRALPLPTEATPQPAQSHEAPATPDAPLTIADAAARARSAAAQRAECDHRWVTTLDGRRVICMRCHETRLRSTVLR